MLSDDCCKLVFCQSEKNLIRHFGLHHTAKSIETYPNIYAGGWAACGPIGNFRVQVNYIGDFPGILPGSATQVPQTVIDNWSTVYEPESVRRVAKAPILSPSGTEDAILKVA